MSIYENSMNLLKEIYDSKILRIDSDTYRAMPVDEKIQLNESIHYLLQKGFIQKYALCTGMPVSYKITALGIDEIEQIKVISNPANNIIINGNVSGIVGHNVTGNTINQGCSLEEFKKLLDSSISNKQEVEEIKKLLEPLFQRMENNEPLDKGVLGNISDHLQKHEGLYTTLLTLIMSYLSK